ncbi:hypothetical protein ACFRDV_40965 [Streptomyces fagopyri]|uniref:hypothetical protein n=1 Tax=Streptomyces fagopyri TaxID=2662397 RepID=UPI0036CDC36B
MDVTPSVQRKLFLLSGNVCAWPDCSEQLAPEVGGYFGQIAHIRAAEEGGPRFDKTMSNNGRRHFANLILLCTKHHRRIDDPETAHQFDPEYLKGIKDRHEDRFRSALAALEQAEQQYVDHTRDQVVVYCSTLQRMYGEELDEEDRLGTAESVNKIADQLRRTTRGARQLLCRVLEEGDGELSVAEAAARGRTSDEEIRDLARQLERLWLAHLESPECDDFDYLPERIVVPDAVRDHNPLLDGYPFFDDLSRHVASRDDLTLPDVLIDLNFSLLD